MTNAKDSRMADSGIFVRGLYGKIALASTIALSGNFLSQIIGTIIAGHMLSETALTVVGVATPIYYVYGAVGAMLGIGCASLCSNHIGKLEFEESNRVFTMTYILTFILAVVITALIWAFIDPITRLLGATENNFAEVKRYCLTMATGGAGVMLVFPAFNILRIDGRNKTAASVFIIAGSISVVLNFIFLVILKTGAEGIAAATCIGLGIAGLIGGLVIFFGSKNFKSMKPKRPFMTASNIIATGTSGAMEYLCFFACMIVMNRLLLERFGETATSVYKIVDSVNNFALIFVWGIAGPMTPMTGVFGGEQDVKSLRDALKFALTRGLLIILPLAALVFVFSGRTAGLFGMETEMAASAVRTFSVSLPLAMINITLIYLYQGARRIFLANAFMALRMALWVIAAAVPLSYISEYAVWWCFAAAEVMAFLSAMGLSAIIRKGNKNLLILLLIDISAEREGRYMAFSAEKKLSAKDAESICDFCRQNNLPQDASMFVFSIIEETLVGVFEKSKPKSANVRILIAHGAGSATVQVRNGGKLFNPVDFKADETDGEGSVDYRNTFGINNTTVILNLKH